SPLVIRPTLPDVLLPSMRRCTRLPGLAILRIRRLAVRQPHLERRAVIEPAAHRERTAMQLDELLDQRQPEPASFVLAREPAFELRKRMKEPAQVTGRDADAGVGDAHLEVALAFEH